MKVDILESIEGKGLGVEAECLAQNLKSGVVVISTDVLRNIVNEIGRAVSFGQLRDNIANDIYNCGNKHELIEVVTNFLEMQKIFDYCKELDSTEEANIEESDDLSLMA